MRPTEDRLVVTELRESTSKGGIVIPATAGNGGKDHTLRCRVVAMGPGQLNVLNDGSRVRVPISEIVGQPIEVGSIVHCSTFTNRHEVAPGEEVRILRAQDVLMVE